MPMNCIPAKRFTEYLFHQFFHLRKLCINLPDLGEHKTSKSKKETASTQITKCGTQKTPLLNLQIELVTAVAPREQHVCGVSASRQATVSVQTQTRAGASANSRTRPEWAGVSGHCCQAQHLGRP